MGLKLKNDVHSFCNPKIIYGLQGDEVRLVSEHGQVLIVKGPDGNCFSVKKSELSEENIKRKTEAEPDTAAPIKPSINQAPPVSKGTAPKKQIQQTLF